MTEKEMETAIGNYMHWYGVATFSALPAGNGFQERGYRLGGSSLLREEMPLSACNILDPDQFGTGPLPYHRSHRHFGIDPFKLARAVADLGDAPLGRTLHPDMAAEDFQAFFEQVFAAGIIPVSVGGDHSITWPILRAARKTRFSEPVGMIHFDSHTDAATRGSRHAKSRRRFYDGH